MAQQTYFPVRRQAPNDHLDWALDHSRWLPSGDKIISSDWEVVTPADATLRVVREGSHSPSYTDNTATVWLESGEENVAYRVRNRVLTLEGRRKDRSFILEVMAQ